MERPEQPTRSYLKEFVWAFVLVNLFAGAAGLLAGIHLDGVGMGLALFLGASLTVTLLLVIVVTATLVWDYLTRALARHVGRWGAAGSAYREHAGSADTLGATSSDSECRAAADAAEADPQP
ncbi:MAG: hypothetical protein FIB01_00150 [Gemmatimonadetes bacterium]|nr:hypothetical protein [Gemmatimonadota bacterium]